MYKLILCEFESIDIAEIACGKIKNQFSCIKKITIKHDKKTKKIERVTIPPQTMNSTGISSTSYPFDVQSTPITINEKDTTNTKIDNNTKVKLKITVNADQINNISILSSTLRNIGASKINII